jgi:ATP-dependent Clp protease adaptor protein ClpS
MNTKEKLSNIKKMGLSKLYVLILHNDDHNSFDWVIECLIRICGHDLEQSAQCAFIVHNNGKCSVKYGDKETISYIKEKLTECGLTVTMELS